MHEVDRYFTTMADSKMRVFNLLFFDWTFFGVGKGMVSWQFYVCKGKKPKGGIRRNHYLGQEVCMMACRLNRKDQSQR